MPTKKLVRTKCQPWKKSPGQNANLGWHFVRLAFCPVGILSYHRVKGTSPFESQLVFQLQVDILQAEQRSNNNNTGFCGGQCSNNKEGEENMNLQGSDSVFLSNSRY